MADRDPTEWAERLQQVYEQHKRPEWRRFLPRQSMAKSQSCLWAICFNSSQAAEFGDRRDTGALMAHFLEGFGRWLSTFDGDDRTTVWVALDIYSQGVGQLASASPEAAARAALKSVPKDRRRQILHRLLGECL